MQTKGNSELQTAVIKIVTENIVEHTRRMHEGVFNNGPLQGTHTQPHSLGWI